MKESKLELQSRETRRAILEAADTLFFSQGYADTSVDDVCRAASVTKGAFYHHFKNKDAVYRSCYIHRLDRYLEAHYSVPDGADADTRFRMLARCTYESSLVCGRELTAQSIIGMLCEHDSRLFEAERIHTRLLREACEAALSEGVFPPDTSAEKIILLYACLLNGFLVKWASAAPDDHTDWEELLMMTISLLTGNGNQKIGKKERDV